MAKLKQITVGKSKTKAEAKDTPQPGTLVIERPDTMLMVDQLASAKELEALTETTIKQYRGELEPIVVELRNAAEAAGMFTKHVQVKGSGANIRYTFKDAYAPIDPLATGSLQELLGPLFSKLFVAGKSVRIKKGKEQMLMDLLGDLCGDLLEIDHHLEPVAEFREKRAEVRSELSEDQNIALDGVVQQVAQRPAMSFK